MKHSKQKVFLALWPDDVLRKQIDALAKSYNAGGKSVLASNLHITLVFVGYADETKLQCIKNFAEMVKANPFDLKINKIGHFKDKVSWLGCEQIPDELIRLQQTLEIGLQKHCDYQPEKRSYMPHITLQRKITKPVSTELAKPIIWSANSFSLIRSQQGESTSVYFELASWDFKA